MLGVFTTAPVLALSADDDSRDYPVTKMTVSANSEELPGTANEGPANFMLDNDLSTFWHTDWQSNLSGSESDRAFVLTLAEEVELDALRYLSRPSDGSAAQPVNGQITQYKVEVSTDNTNWTTASEGAWVVQGGTWFLAEFTQPMMARYVKLTAVGSYSDGGRYNHFVSGAEVRVRVAEAIQNFTVTIDANGGRLNPEYASFTGEANSVVYLPSLANGGISREGYRLAGFKVMSTNQTITYDAFTITQNESLIAQWVPSTGYAAISDRIDDSRDSSYSRTYELKSNQTGVVFTPSISTGTSGSKSIVWEGPNGRSSIPNGTYTLTMKENGLPLDYDLQIEPFGSAESQVLSSFVDNNNGSLTLNLKFSDSSSTRTAVRTQWTLTAIPVDLKVEVRNAENALTAADFTVTNVHQETIAGTSTNSVWTASRVPSRTYTVKFNAPTGVIYTIDPNVENDAVATSEPNVFKIEASSIENLTSLLGAFVETKEAPVNVNNFRIRDYTPGWNNPAREYTLVAEDGTEYPLVNRVQGYTNSVEMGANGLVDGTYTLHITENGEIVEYPWQLHQRGYGRTEGTYTLNDAGEPVVTLSYKGSENQFIRFDMRTLQVEYRIQFRDSGLNVVPEGVSFKVYSPSGEEVTGQFKKDTLSYNQWIWVADRVVEPGLGKIVFENDPTVSVELSDPYNTHGIATDVDNEYLLDHYPGWHKDVERGVSKDGATVRGFGVFEVSESLTHNVTYLPNGGQFYVSVDGILTHVSDPQSFVVEAGSYTTLRYDNSPLVLSRPGYKFVGWLNESTGEVIEDYGVKTIEVTQDTTLVAQWKQTTGYVHIRDYTVGYDDSARTITLIGEDGTRYETYDPNLESPANLYYIDEVPNGTYTLEITQDGQAYRIDWKPTITGDQRAIVSERMVNDAGDIQYSVVYSDKYNSGVNVAIYSLQGGLTLEVTEVGQKVELPVVLKDAYGRVLTGDYNTESNWIGTTKDYFDRKIIKNIVQTGLYTIEFEVPEGKVLELNSEVEQKAILVDGVYQIDVVEGENFGAFKLVTPTQSHSISIDWNNVDVENRTPIEVQLLKDGEPYGELTQITESQYTWDNLPEGEYSIQLGTEPQEYLVYTAAWQESDIQVVKAVTLSTKKVWDGGQQVPVTFGLNIITDSGVNYGIEQLLEVNQDNNWTANWGKYPTVIIEMMDVRIPVHHVVVEKDVPTDFVVDDNASDLTQIVNVYTKTSKEIVIRWGTTPVEDRTNVTFQLMADGVAVGEPITTVEDSYRFENLDRFASTPEEGQTYQDLDEIVYTVVGSAEDSSLSVNPHVDGFTFSVLKKYTVNYDGNGGTVNSDAASLTMTAGFTHFIKADNELNPTRENHTFLGWKVAGDETLYKAGDRYSVNADTVFLAQWEANTVTVTYNPNGGTRISNVDGISQPISEPISFEVPVGAYKTLSVNSTKLGIKHYGGSAGFQRDGYYFTGWRLVETDTVLAHTGTGRNFGVHDITLTDDITLEAQWIPTVGRVDFKDFTEGYRLLGRTIKLIDEAGNVVATKDAAGTVGENVPSRSYRFDNIPNGTYIVEVYQDGVKMDVDWDNVVSPGQNTSINGSTNENGDYVIEVKFNDQSKTSTVNINLLSNKGALTLEVRDTNGNLTQVPVVVTDANGLVNEGTYNTENKWIGISQNRMFISKVNTVPTGLYTIEFTVPEGKVLALDTTTEQEAVLTDGVYTIDVTEAGALGGFILKDIHTVTLDGNGGSFGESVETSFEVVHGETYKTPYNFTVQLTRPGYSFAGWLIQGTETVHRYPTDIVIESDTVLVAQWTESQGQFTIFDYTNGFINTDNSRTFKLIAEDGTEYPLSSNSYTNIYRDWKVLGIKNGTYTLVVSENGEDISKDWTLEKFGHPKTESSYVINEDGSITFDLTFEDNNSSSFIRYKLNEIPKAEATVKVSVLDREGNPYLGQIVKLNLVQTELDGTISNDPKYPVDVSILVNENPTTHTEPNLPTTVIDLGGELLDVTYMYQLSEAPKGFELDDEASDFDSEVYHFVFREITTEASVKVSVLDREGNPYLGQTVKLNLIQTELDGTISNDPNYPVEVSILVNENPTTHTETNLPTTVIDLGGELLDVSYMYQLSEAPKGFELDDVASDFDSEVYHFVFRDVSLPDIIPNIPDENGEYPVAPGYVTVNFFIPEEYKAGAHLEGVASYLVNPEANVLHSELVKPTIIIDKIGYYTENYGSTEFPWRWEGWSRPITGGRGIAANIFKLDDIIPNIPDENGDYPVAPGYVTVNFSIPREYQEVAHLEGVSSYLVNPEAGVLHSELEKPTIVIDKIGYVTENYATTEFPWRWEGWSRPITTSRGISANIVKLDDIIANIPDEKGDYPVTPGYVTVNFFIPKEYQDGAHLEGVASYRVNPEAGVLHSDLIKPIIVIDKIGYYTENYGSTEFPWRWEGWSRVVNTGRGISANVFKLDDIIPNVQDENGDYPVAPDYVVVNFFIPEEFKEVAHLEGVASYLVNPEAGVLHSDLVKPTIVISDSNYTTENYATTEFPWRWEGWSRVVNTGRGIAANIVMAEVVPEPIIGDVHVSVIDSNGNGVEDAVVGIYQPTPVMARSFARMMIRALNTDPMISESTTDQEGLAVVNNLDAGTYYAQLVSVPEGYVLSEDKVEFVIDSSDPTQVTIMVEVEQPSDPEVPVEPTDPVAPVDPTDPVVTEKPTEPVVPEEPTDPEGPVIQPTDPVESKPEVPQAVQPEVKVEDFKQTDKKKELPKTGEASSIILGLVSTTSLALGAYLILRKKED